MMKNMIQRSIILAACLLAPLVSASAASPKMPTFFTRRDYTGLDTYCVQVVDTNGDGIPDLITDSDGSILVLLGNGDGAFRTGPSSSTVVRSLKFVAADMNGDGAADVVQSGGGEVGVSLGNGDGTFQYGVAYPVPDGLTPYLVVGDFNGDGIPDVAVTGNMGVWLLTGKGDGTLNPAVLAAPLAYGSEEIAAADFNGDGLGLVVTLPNGGTDRSGAGFVVLLGNGDGTFQAPQTFTRPKKAGSLAVGPLAEGGYPSIAMSGYGTSDIFLYFGNGAGGFSGPHYANLPGGDMGLVIGDVNGDGIPDLISGGVYIAFGTGTRVFKSPVYYPVESFNGVSDLVLADLRNNGLTDIVTGAYEAISVLLSLGKGKYEDGEWTAVAGGAGCGAAADFNGDGKPDLAVISSTGVSILLGTGKAASPFATGTPVAVTGAACLVTGDLNGDGIPDLLVAVNGNPNALLSYLGNGDGTFTLKSTTPTPNSGGSVVLADFNHDGKLDFGTSGNLLALGNGDGTFQTPAPIVSSPPSSGFSYTATGDINNDGWPDLVLTNSASPANVNLYVLLNNRQGGFTRVPSNIGAETVQAILADFNGDGNLDLLLQGLDGGGFVCLGDGKGQFSTECVNVSEGVVGFGPNLVADVNGDGILDILELGSDTVAIHLGNGDATFTQWFEIGTGPSPSGILVENLHGQAASAGLPDIVTPDGSGGVRVLINLTK